MDAEGQNQNSIKPERVDLTNEDNRERLRDILYATVDVALDMILVVDPCPDHPPVRGITLESDVAVVRMKIADQPPLVVADSYTFTYDVDIHGCDSCRRALDIWNEQQEW
jgi:hypothetical protein